LPSTVPLLPVNCTFVAVGAGTPFGYPQAFILASFRVRTPNRA